MDTMLQYLDDAPFDVERFVLLVQDHIDVDDVELDIYLDDILHDYEQWEYVDEIEARSVLYDKAYPVFTEVFADYYADGFLTDIIHYSEEDVHVSSQLSDVLKQPTRTTTKTMYIDQIRNAFDSYQSSSVRQSLVKWAQKILVQELIKSKDTIWSDELIDLE